MYYNALYNKPLNGDKIITTQDIIQVKKTDLPLSCPMPGKTLWNYPPKVYLPIKSETVTCPYCGTKYRLVD